VELDLIAGWVFELADGVSLDAGATYYLYPSDSAINYAEASITLSHEIAGATGRLGLAYVPGQAATRDQAGRKRDNLYTFAGLSFPLGRTPLTLNGQFGHERGAFDFSSRGGKWDWQLGLSLKADSFTLGVRYVDASVRGGGPDSKLTEPSLVASILFGF
jgi:uncharacterized protein (TIGR02001 family)